MSSLSQKSSDSSERQLPGVPDVSAAFNSKAEAAEILDTVVEHRIGLQPVH